MLVISLWAAGCGDPPAVTCPAGSPLEVDIEAWEAALMEAVRSAAPGAASERDRLLGQLGLAPLPSGASGVAPVLSGPTDFKSFLVRRGAEASDRLVAVRFRAADGAEFLRAQLLRPVPRRDGLFCPLGDDLSRDKEAHEEPCLEPHDGVARALGAEPLVAPNRFAVVVRDAGGWCGPGTSRADRLATSWWGVEGDRLVRYLEVVTHESRYESPAPPSRVRRAEIAISGGWPRTITVTEVVECHPLDDATDADCQPHGSFTRYQYTDGSYVADATYAAAEAPEPTASTGPGEEETDP